MANEVVRIAAKRAGVKLWEVADYCGMADTTLSRQMRKELPKERQQTLLGAIKSTPGHLTDYNCDRCKNRGYSAELRGGYIVSVECPCSGMRPAWKTWASPRRARPGVGGTGGQQLSGKWILGSKW